MKRIYQTIFLLGLLITSASCTRSNDASPSAPSVLTFSVNQAKYSEADGQSISLYESLIYVDVVLNTKQPAEVGSLQFSWTGTKTTYRNGDFALGTPGVFAPGQTKARLMFAIINDRQIDLDDTLVVTLTGVTGNAVLSNTPSERKFMLIISNDDVLPANSLQADLTWSTGSGGNIDAANLDLYIQYNVVYDSVNNLITQTGDTQTMSNTLSGFETTFLNAHDVDQTYWIAVPFVSGADSVDFTLALNGFGRNGSTFMGSYGPGDVGKGMFFGPFIKSGQTFTSGRSSFIPKRDKVYAVKTNHFPR